MSNNVTNSKENIFYLAGFPRSGTTWFANILNSHPRVIYRHEIIGRNHHIFGKDLYDALIHNNGLSDNEFNLLKQRISEARVDTDKPPFFYKKHGLLKHKKIHYYAWILAKTLPFLSSLYRALFTTSPQSNFNFLIKETRTARNLGSIISGMRPSAILFLVRKPHGTIASHVKGIQKNTMPPVDPDRKKQWYCNNKQTTYILEQGLIESDFINMNQVEFFAIQWRVYHDELLSYAKKFPRAHFYSYEAFVEDPQTNTDLLLSNIQLDNDENVYRFISDSSGKNNADKNPKDASNEYYSVYRKSTFNHESWKDVLSEDDIKTINKHTNDAYKIISESYFNK